VKVSPRKKNSGIPSLSRDQFGLSFLATKAELILRQAQDDRTVFTKLFSKMILDRAINRRATFGDYYGINLISAE
jgi:hypothetical protein